MADATKKGRRKRYGPRQRERAARMVEDNDGLAYRVVNRVLGLTSDDAHYDDACQEMLFVLWRCALGFDPSRGFRFSTYAYGSMLRHIPKWRAKVLRHGFGHTGGEMVPVPFALTEERVIALAAPADEPPPDGSVWGVVNQLEPRARRVLRLRFRDGRTLEGVGQELGLTRERVRQLQVAALGELRELMGVG